jgi:hypothetical protein
MILYVSLYISSSWLVFALTGFKFKLRYPSYLLIICRFVVPILVLHFEQIYIVF